MSCSEHVPIDQHNVEIQRNANSWKNKEILRTVYGSFYGRIKQQLCKQPGLTVELGSGIGQAKEFIPDCITTDLFKNPWIDQVESAYKLSFASQSVANIILFDVWHHLQFPGTAMEEFRRVLIPQGRIILFEPSMGILGRFVLGVFHHEPLGLNLPINWFAESPEKANNSGYYAAQGNAWRIFGKEEYREWQRDWKLKFLDFLPAVAYLGSGGFSGPQLYPKFVYPVLESFEYCLRPFAKTLSSRMLVTLERIN